MTTKFNVTGTYEGFDGSPLAGDVWFQPVRDAGDMSPVTGVSPSVGVVPTVVPARIVAGQLQALNGTTLQLTSNASDLGLATPLQYQVWFHNLTVNGEPTSLPGFTFNAPADSTPVDLVAIAPPFTPPAPAPTPPPTDCPPDVVPWWTIPADINGDGSC